jgi:hypothetical protein
MPSRPLIRSFKIIVEEPPFRFSVGAWSGLSACRSETRPVEAQKANSAFDGPISRDSPLNAEPSHARQGFPLAGERACRSGPLAVSAGRKLPGRQRVRVVRSRSRSRVSLAVAAKHITPRRRKRVYATLTLHTAARAALKSGYLRRRKSGEFIKHQSFLCHGFYVRFNPSRRQREFLNIFIFKIFHQAVDLRRIRLQFCNYLLCPDVHFMSRSRHWFRD